MYYYALKDKVTHFSTQLKLEPKNIDYVKVGGVIKEINPPLNLYIPPFILESTGEECEGVDFREYYTLLVDDGLGELIVYVSKDLYAHKKDFIEKDKVCIFDGMTNTLSRKIQGEHVVDVTVYAYDVDETLLEEVKA